MQGFWQIALARGSFDGAVADSPSPPLGRCRVLTKPVGNADKGYVASPTYFQLDDVERARILDFARRLRAVRRQALLVLVVVVALGVFSFGPLILPPAVLLALAYLVLGRALRNPRRPERPLIAVLIFTQAMIVAMIALADQFRLDNLGLLILPAAAACILLPRRLMMVSVAWSVAVMIGAAFAIDPARILDEPPVLILPLGVMLCVALPAAMIRQLEIESRDTALIDTLTGALNRVALETRIAELTAQAHTLPLRMGVLMGDLDRFKLVNDELGHEAGDAVLRETVRRMRSVLGPLTPIYRVGGEEFAVLIAGADEPQVQAIAERLREAVRDESIGDRTVTISFGIAAATLDQYPVARILEVADEALYRAKRAGRDRVASANLRPMTVVPQSPNAASQAEVGTEMAPAGAVGASGTAVGAAVVAGRGMTDEPLLVRDRVVTAPEPIALGHDNGNWIVRGDFERDHIRDSAKALNRTHHGALGFVGLALLASIPWVGWHLMVPAIPAVIAYHVAERRIMQIRRPEYVLGGAWLSVQLAILAGAWIANGADPYMLILFSPMMIGMTAVYPTRGVLLNSAITVALCIAGGFVGRPDLMQNDFGLLGPPILIIIGIALMSSVTGRSAIEHRTKAVVDPLTGLLTRAALRSRLSEIGHEAQVDGARVSVIAFDIDHFKHLNDEHGHATGDDALRAVGVATRRHLQALEWAFRLGGDEFVIVVPTAQAAAADLADRIRLELETVVISGVALSGSFGVAATAPGESFDFDQVCRRADAALYEAKRAGRNRVAVAPIVGPGPTPVATMWRDIA